MANFVPEATLRWHSVSDSIPTHCPLTHSTQSTSSTSQPSRRPRRLSIAAQRLQEEEDELRQRLNQTQRLKHHHQPAHARISAASQYTQLDLDALPRQIAAEERAREQEDHAGIFREKDLQALRVHVQEACKVQQGTNEVEPSRALESLPIAARGDRSVHSALTPSVHIVVFEDSDRQHVVVVCLLTSSPRLHLFNTIDSHRFDADQHQAQHDVVFMPANLHCTSPSVRPSLRSIQAQPSFGQLGMTHFRRRGQNYPTCEGCCSAVAPAAPASVTLRSSSTTSLRLRVPRPSGRKPSPIRSSHLRRLLLLHPRNRLPLPNPLMPQLPLNSFGLEHIFGAAGAHPLVRSAVGIQQFLNTLFGGAASGTSVRSFSESRD